MTFRLLRSALAALAVLVLALVPVEHGARAATQVFAGESCFQATAGINGMVGAIQIAAGGSGGTTGVYGGVPLTGGLGSSATANITVSGGAVTSVAILNPGANYITGDALSAASGNIGGVSGFSIQILSVSINSSLAGGSVAFYIPGTQTFSSTYQDPGATILNTNPVILDQNGCALIYGNGLYRQVLKDSLGNIVWDQVAGSSTSASVSWGSISGGSPNAQTVTAQGFNGVDGQVVSFIAGFSNTGPTTLAVNGGSAFSIVQGSTNSPQNISSGEITVGNIITVTYVQAAGAYFLTNATSDPVGEIKDFEGGSVPPGFLATYGQCVAVATYPQLYAVIGTNFGSCGVGFFAIPDLRGRVIAGLDNMGGTSAARLSTTIPGSTSIGGTGGSQSTVLVASEIPVMTPALTGSVTAAGTGTGTGSASVTFPGLSYNAPSSPAASAAAGVAVSVVQGQTASTTGGAGPTSFPVSVTNSSISINVTNTLAVGAVGGGSAATPTVQPTMMMFKIIRYQ